MQPQVAASRRPVPSVCLILHLSINFFCATNRSSQQSVNFSALRLGIALLQHGALVDAADASQRTPLRIAAFYNSVAAASALALHGASLTTVRVHFLSPQAILSHLTIAHGPVAYMIPRSDLEALCAKSFTSPGGCAAEELAYSRCVVGMWLALCRST